MGKVLSKVTPIVLCALITAESFVSAPLKTYAFDGEAELFVCAQEEKEELLLEQGGSSEVAIEEDNEADLVEVSEAEEVSEELNGEPEELEYFLSDEVLDSENNEASEESAEEPGEVTADNKCGDNATWRVEEDPDDKHYHRNKLIIEGTGDMYDYSAENTAPWMKELEKASKIIVSDGITSIGDYAFYYKVAHVSYQVGNVEIADTVNSIGDYAFYGIRVGHVNLPKIMDSIGKCAFYDCFSSNYTNAIRFPESIRYIGKYAFCSAVFTEPVVFGGTEEIDEGAFSNAVFKRNVSFTDSLKKVGRHAFYYSHINSYGTLNIPGSVEEIGFEAFGDGEYSFVKFWGGIPENIGLDAFSSGYSYFTIYYPQEYPEWEEYFAANPIVSWVRNRKVEFKSFKSVCTVSIHDPYGNVIEEKYPAYTKLTPPELKLKDGDEIYGWYTEDEYQWEGTRFDFSKSLLEDVSMYARLTSADCRVIFETGCEVEVPEQSVPSGKTATNPGVIETEGAVFSKWVVKEADDESRAFDFDTVLYEDITLRAVWAEPGNVSVTVGNRSFRYTGKPITLSDLHVFIDRKEIEEGNDYTVEYQDNVNRGFTFAVIKLRGNYSGTYGIPFHISQAVLDRDDEKSDVALVKEEVVLKYNGKLQKAKPQLVVKGEGNTYVLKEGKDYTLTYEGTDKKADDYDSDAFKYPGYYSVKIEGKGNFTGEMNFYVTITQDKDLRKATVKVLGDCKYTGEPVWPEISVKYGAKLLVSQEKADESEGKLTADYYVDYDENISAGKGTLYVYPAENSEFFGVKKVTFDIKGTPIKNAKVEGIENLVYNGSEQLQEGLKLTVDGKELKGISFETYEEGKETGDFTGFDYTYEYVGNKDAGKAKLILRGLNGFFGEVTKSFTISPKAIDSTFTVGADENVVYNPKGAKPEVTVAWEKESLISGTDFTVSYAKNKKPGKATAKITGKGNYKGTATVNFEIVKADIADFDVAVSDVTFRKPAYISQPEVYVYDQDGNRLKVGKDLSKKMTYRYVNDTTVTQNKKPAERKAGEEVGKKDCISSGTLLECTISGNGGYTGEVTKNFRVVKASISKAKVTVADMEYTGRPVVPEKRHIKVKVGKTYIQKDDYEIISCLNNVKTGKATVVLRGKGDFGGIKTVTFVIKPRETRQF